MQNWNLKTQIAYSLGKDDQENNLPFISPLRYNAGIEFKKEKIAKTFTYLDILTMPENLENLVQKEGKEGPQDRVLHRHPERGRGAAQPGRLFGCLSI